jgi:MoxR-like ATPase
VLYDVRTVSTRRKESMTEITSVDDTQALLVQGNYVADRALATSLYLALKLGRPLFLEGEAGVGKTEIGKVLADVLHRRLVRLPRADRHRCRPPPGNRRARR